MSAASSTTKSYVAICKSNAFVIVEKEAKSIKDQLKYKILKAIEDKVDANKLHFNKAGLVTDGYYFVEPANEEAMNWLLEQHCNLNVYPCGQIQLEMKKIESLISLTDENADCDKLYENMFRGQNQHLKHLMIDEWKFIVKKGYELLVSVPQSVANQIDKSVQIYSHFSMIGATLKHVTAKPIFVE